jgi:hypothetical protein
MVVRERAGGAAARGGLRARDRIDLRRQPLESRIAVLYQLMATRSTTLTVYRGASTRTLTVVGSTAWDNATFWKLQPMVSRLIGSAWFSLCALLIALRRWRLRGARRVSFVFLCAVGEMLDPSFFVVAPASAALLLLVVSRACSGLTYLLLVRLSSGCGSSSYWRTALENVVSSVIVLGFFADMLAVLGVATSWINPLPFVMTLSPLRGYLDILACALVVLTSSAAVSATPREERARAVSLLLPLPIAFFMSAMLFTVPAFVSSWFATVVVLGMANAATLLGAAAVTYSLLHSSRRRNAIAA